MSRLSQITFRLVCRRLLAIAIATSVLSAAQTGPGESTALRLRLAESISRALNLNRSVESVADRLEVLSPDLLIPHGARLHLVSAKPAPDTEAWLLRMDCRDPHDCLPFYALLHGHSEIRYCGSMNSARPPRSASKALSAALVHAGEVVRLTETRSGLHLTARAISLDAGTIGENVRVRNTSSQMVLLAVVAGQGLVRVAEAP